MGEQSVTELTHADKTRKVVIRHPRGTYSDAPTARRYVVRLHGLSAPVGMRVNGSATLLAFTSEAAAIVNGTERCGIPPGRSCRS
ncbi:DUF5110 domain-containing protein [Streptomyces sp. NPDC051644]|uniref:DUF5110 domain-containing protein n=1 Tax=Streptomyces sp. NPDC051644 TaxID=3365666 RepID=UPI0037B09E23